MKTIEPLDNTSVGLLERKKKKPSSADLGAKPEPEPEVEKFVPNKESQCKLEPSEMDPPK